MARKYLFVCDGCGSSAQCDSERLPAGWAIVTATYLSSRGLRTTALDLCSGACISKALESAPELAGISAASQLEESKAQAQLAPTEGSDVTSD